MPFFGRRTGTFDLAAYRGKVVVLNFWASWCIECVGEMPGFQHVFQSLGSKLSFVGMNVLDLQGETKGAGETFAKRTGVHYILAFDPHGYLYAHFSASTLRPVMPISIFVGPDLRVRQLHFGPLTAAELRADIASIFGVR
jgi:thiol-disulfide isomerase/thioredoxin